MVNNKGILWEWSYLGLWLTISISNKAWMDKNKRQAQAKTAKKSLRKELKKSEEKKKRLDAED